MLCKEIILLKTSPHNYNDIKQIAVTLNNHPCITTWNIDLDDFDKVIRIENKGLNVEEIVNSLYGMGVWSDRFCAYPTFRPINQIILFEQINYISFNASTTLMM